MIKTPQLEKLEKSLHQLLTMETWHHNTKSAIRFLKLAIADEKIEIEKELAEKYHPEMVELRSQRDQLAKELQDTTNELEYVHQESENRRLLMTRYRQRMKERGQTIKQLCDHISHLKAELEKPAFEIEIEEPTFKTIPCGYTSFNLTLKSDEGEVELPKHEVSRLQLYKESREAFLKAAAKLADIDLAEE